MLISGSISSATLKVAEGKGSNLLEDMKKSRMGLHCEALWVHVYGHERALASEAELREEAVLIEQNEAKIKRLCDVVDYHTMAVGERRDYERVLKKIGLTKAGWEMLFAYGIQIPVPRALISYRLRYDLSKIKDWYDGAPFHYTDTKLQDQFDGADLLQAARQATGQAKQKWRHMRRRAKQKFWFSMITRAVQLRVASACRYLDRKYEDYHFTPDHFLWPNVELDQSVLEMLGEEAVAELEETRHHLFQKIFHHEAVLAHQLMRKAIYPNFAAATELRRGIDPEYVCGDSGQSWCGDVHHYDEAFKQTPRAELMRQRGRRKARTEQDVLRQYLHQYAIYVECEMATYRAIRIAFHTDYCGLKQMILSGVQPNTIRRCRGVNHYGKHTKRDAPATVTDILADVTEKKEYFSRLLRGVRLHHELTRLELEDYAYYLDQILH